MDVEVVSVVKQLKQTIGDVVRLDTELNSDEDLSGSLFARNPYPRLA